METSLGFLVYVKVKVNIEKAVNVEKRVHQALNKVYWYNATEDILLTTWEK